MDETQDYPEQYDSWVYLDVVWLHGDCERQIVCASLVEAAEMSLVLLSSGVRRMRRSIRAAMEGSLQASSGEDFDLRSLISWTPAWQGLSAWRTDRET